MLLYITLVFSFMRFYQTVFPMLLLSAVVSFAQTPSTLVVFDSIPKAHQLFARGEGVRVTGTVVHQSVRSIAFAVNKDKAIFYNSEFDASGSEKVFSITVPLEQGLFEYSFVAVADTGGVPDTIAVVDDILCGEVIAINGQSNSIFGDPYMHPSPWARTFGGNFSSSPADTAYSQSSTIGNGGGSNVGVWGLYLQNRIAADMNYPTCVINGGVGGTTIQQHLPDPNNTYNLATIYGSWLYRLEKSGLRKHVRWLFWYQGESNAGTENYMAMFDQLYNNWKLDLPALQHIIVIQIRPGCGLTEHATLREQQRLLESKYPDVKLHAAAGLPAHDGCHYAGIGYQTLGEQLFNIYRTTELSRMLGTYATSPMVDTAICANDECTLVRLTFKRYNKLRITNDTMVGGVLRRYTDAFFANGDESLHPRNAVFSDSDVVLVFNVSVQSVSYIPASYYSTTPPVYYEGPWLVNEDGVGALTFHNVQTNSTTGVVELDNSRTRKVETRCISIQCGDPLPEHLTSALSLTGEQTATLSLTGQHVNTLNSGVYVARIGEETVLLLIRP